MSWPACSLAADLYAILKCTEKLERAYVRDGVTAKEYEGQCEKLIAQFKMLWGSMKETVRRTNTQHTAAAHSAAIAISTWSDSHLHDAPEMRAGRSVWVDDRL